jgi:hypothetical protein
MTHEFGSEDPERTSQESNRAVGMATGSTAGELAGPTLDASEVV